MNDFEKHIRNNQRQLEPDEVNPKIWLAIENEVLRAKEKRKTFYLRVMSLAAVIVLGLMVFKMFFLDIVKNIIL